MPWRAASAYQRERGEKVVPKSVFKESAQEVAKPILFAGLIVIIVFLPILSLQGVEGKMFRPMAFTFMSALTGALILSVTVMPVMASLFLARRVSATDTWLVRKLKQSYEPMLKVAMARPVIMLSTAALVFVVSAFVASRFGVEFVPKLDEGDIAIQAVRLPSVSLETSLTMTREMEKTLKRFPQVESVISKTGRPEIANDPMGVHQTSSVPDRSQAEIEAESSVHGRAEISQVTLPLRCECPRSTPVFSLRKFFPPFGRVGRTPKYRNSWLIRRRWILSPSLRDSRRVPKD